MRDPLRRTLALGLSLHLVALPIAADAQRDIHNWNNIRSVPAGQTVRASLDANRAIEGLLANVDDESVALIPAPPSTPEKACTRLASLLAEHADAFGGPATTESIFPSQQVRLSPTGVFVGDTRIGALADVVQVIERPHVAAVDRIHAGSRKGAVVGVLIGVAIGLWRMGSYVWTALSDKPCQPNCPSSGGAIATGVAAATLGGIIGSRVGHRTDPDPIYRRQ